MRTSPEVGSSKPSRISMVVVLPAPLGPRRPKHSPSFDLQIEAAQGFDFGVVGLAEAAALDGDAHGIDCSGVFGEARRRGEGVARRQERGGEGGGIGEFGRGRHRISVRPASGE